MCRRIPLVRNDSDIHRRVFDLEPGPAGWRPVRGVGRTDVDAKVARAAFDRVVLMETASPSDEVSKMLFTRFDDAV